MRRAGPGFRLLRLRPIPCVNLNQASSLCGDRANWALCADFSQS